MKIRFLVLLVLQAVLTITGCASVSLENSWKDPAISNRQYRNILVVAIVEKQQMRQVFEEVFAEEIRKRSATGTASYSLTGVTDKPSRAALEDAVKKSGADAVITARMVGLKKDTDARTGFVMTDRGFSNVNYSGAEVYPTNYLDFYGGAVSYASFEHQAVSVTKSIRMTVESNLFDTGTGKLVWSGASDAVDPQGIITISKGLAERVIKALAQDGLL
jgi:hypothetical protein